MAEEVKYNNTLVSGRADETLSYTRYIKDESSGKSTKELLDEKVNKTDKLGTTQIADKAVTTEKLENESVTTDKLDSASVTTDKVADANITTSKLADSSVETEKINNSAVTTDKLNDGAVDNSKLSPDAVTSEKIKDESIITEKLNVRAVTTEKVEEKAITNSKLGDQSVDGRVVREASLESKHFANESVTTEKVARKSITKDKLADNSVDDSQVVDGSIGNAKLSPDSVTTEKIKDSSVTNEKVANDTLGIEKFDPELRKTIQAATGLPEDLSQMIQDVDKSIKQLHEKDTDLQSQVDDKQEQITANKSAQDTKNASLDENMKKLNTRDDQITETLKNISATGGASVASAVTYDNTTSQLTSANIQGAVDELQGAKIDKTSILQEFGEAEDKVMSQKAVTNKLSSLSVGLESFKGKTILCLGDSITHDGAYTTPLSSLLGAKIINRGSSGSSIAIRGNNISFVERVQLPQSDESGTALGMPTKADVVIFYGGVNDWMASSVDFGTTKEGENTDTFCGSVFFVFNKLKQYYPNASFFVVNNYNVYSPNVFHTASEIKYADNEDGVYEYIRNIQGKTFDDYRNAIIEISKLFGFKMIDLKNVGFSFFKNEDREKYSYLNNGNHDGLHPNEEGGKLMAKHMAKQMCNAVSVQKELEGRLIEVESSNDKLFLSTGLFETISDSYVEEDGSINYQKNYKRTSYIRCDTAKYVIITSSVKDSKFNAFYDKDKKFISTFFTAYWNDNIKEAGNRNVIKVPDGACYYIVSNTNAGFEGTVIKNSLEYDPISTSRIYDVYIASKGSKYAKFVDYVTDGVNDQEMINSIISDSGVNSVYIYGDSTFLLSAPIKVKDNLKIKSNGATFNNIDMITHKIVSSATTGNQVVLDSTEGFRIGMWLYFEDDKGNNDWNVITRIDKTTPPKIVLKNNIKNVWDKANNPVVKSANMCFLIDNVQNVEIDGVVVDWNVDNNPIQKYNPTYLQEAFTLNDSTDIVIRNCIGKNGGRRGLCTHDVHRLLIENCTFYNWKEHGIDLFNSYTTNGNTREYPFLTDTVVTNCRCYDNAMAGIQNHRGSGCLINKCELFNNNYGVSAQEYAHDIVVSDCLIHDNKLQQVYVRQDSYNISILGCIIAGSVGWEGVEVYNARKVLICNNQINNNSRAGIALINGKMCKIHGNILSANNKMITKPSETGLYSAQVSISDNSDRNVISDNFIHLDAGGSNYGVWEDGSDYNTVYENDFVGMKVESVKLTGSNSSKRNNREYSS